MMQLFNFIISPFQKINTVGALKIVLMCNRSLSTYLAQENLVQKKGALLIKKSA
jgi:hypothetical protein